MDIDMNIDMNMDTNIYTKDDNPILQIDDKSKIIGKGSYGCVYKPGVYIDSQKEYNYVSKIIFDNNSFYTEKRQFYLLNNEIDKESKFTLKEFKFVNEKSKKEFFRIGMNETINKCLVETRKNTEKEAYVINMENGGIEFKNINNQNIKKEFILEFLYGIEKLIENKLIHNDIKPENILINDRKISLIDFGLIDSFHNIFSKNNISILKHNYSYYPPEYKIIAFIYEYFGNSYTYKDKNSFLYFMNTRYDECYKNHIIIYKRYYPESYNKQNLENEYRTKIEDISNEIDNNKLFNIYDVKKLETFINSYFDCKKIDIYGFGVVLSMLNYKVLEMIKSDDKQRFNIEQVINGFKQIGGRAENIISVKEKSKTKSKTKSKKKMEKESSVFSISSSSSPKSSPKSNKSLGNTKSFQLSEEEKLERINQISKQLRNKTKMEKYMKSIK